MRKPHPRVPSPRQGAGSRDRPCSVPAPRLLLHKSRAGEGERVTHGPRLLLATAARDTPPCGLYREGLLGLPNKFLLRTRSCRRNATLPLLPGPCPCLPSANEERPTRPAVRPR